MTTAAPAGVAVVIHGRHEFLVRLAPAATGAIGVVAVAIRVMILIKLKLALGSGRVAVQTTSPPRRSTSIIQAIDAPGVASRTLRPVAVALCLGEAAVGARTIGANLPQSHGQRCLFAARRGAMITNTVQLQALAVAAAIWSAITFDLESWRRADYVSECRDGGGGLTI